MVRVIIAHHVQPTAKSATLLQAASLVGKDFLQVPTDLVAGVLLGSSSMAIIVMSVL
jgi:hypothetical protein